MRFAVADPPYVGQARKHYAKEAAAAGRVASEVDHRALIEQLETYDGWALCLSSPSLLGPDGIAAMCPPGCRVAAWVKPFGFMKPGIWPVYAWEPVIFKKPKGRKCPRNRETPKDWTACNPFGVKRLEREQGHQVKGSKPPAFCYWLFDILDMRPEDEMHDLFPGSGGVTTAWEAWRTWDRTTAMRPSTEQLALGA